VAAVLAASATLALVSGCGHSKKPAISLPTTSSSLATTTTTTAGTTTTTTKARHVPVCPLTGLAPRDGHVPQRAALAVKVENLPEARPQWGLDATDIVFEEPVEGGITRFIAVYQCHVTPRIEPVRSGRLVDAVILEPLGHVLFAYSGAIQPVVDEIDSPTSLLEDVGANKAPGAYQRDPTRIEPHNLFTSTAALWAAAATLDDPSQPPAPIFKYGPLPAGGTTVSAVNIFYPLDVTTWTWKAKTGRWVRYYSRTPSQAAAEGQVGTGPAIQGDNVQISATDVVVMRVVEYPTPYVEDDTGALEQDLRLTGTGEAWVFRNGVELKGTWDRPTLAQPATFTEADGTTITLAPGNTWEELLPTSDSISVVAPSATTTSVPTASVPRPSGTTTTR
jgi:hypothetical protein